MRVRSQPFNISWLQPRSHVVHIAASLPGVASVHHRHASGSGIKERRTIALDQRTVPNILASAAAERRLAATGSSSRASAPSSAEHLHVTVTNLKVVFELHLFST